MRVQDVIGVCISYCCLSIRPTTDIFAVYPVQHQVLYLRLQDVIGVCLSYCCLSGTTPGIISAFEDVILDGFETKHVTG